MRSASSAAVVDHQPVAELVGQAHGGGDVVGPVAVLPPGDLPAQDHAERLPAQVALHRLVVGVLMLGQVVGRLDEGVADHRRGPQPRGGELLAIAEDALGVLPERRLHAAGRAEHHLVHRLAGAADRHRLAADRVAGPRVDVHRQHPAGDRVLEAEVGRVDGVQRADVRGDRVGHLVGVLAGPALALLVHPEVHVRVDQPGQHHLAGGVHALRAVGDAHVPAERPDGAALEQDGAVGERRALDGDDAAADDRQRSHAHGRVQGCPFVGWGRLSRPRPAGGSLAFAG
jgi:hypothetical protein